MALLEGRTGFVAGTFMGLGLGATAHRWWPAVGPAIRPLTRALVKTAVVGFEKGRERAAQAGESLEDILAEVGEDLRRHPRGDGHEAPAPPPEEASAGAPAANAGNGVHSQEEHAQ